MKEEEQFRQQALHDSLPGLFNRRGLEQKLDLAFKQARATATVSCLLMIDVDALKYVNDRYGHVIGDSYLRDVAARVRKAVRAEDSVIRFGGDEFWSSPMWQTGRMSSFLRIVFSTCCQSPGSIRG